MTDSPGARLNQRPAGGHGAQGLPGKLDGRNARWDLLSFLCLITPLCFYLYGGLYGGCMRKHI
jgi:hypothetical protein